MGTKQKQVSLRDFRQMSGQARVQLYRDDPLKYKELMAEQARDAIASLTAATAALRDQPEQPLIVTLGPVQLPWNALLHVVDPATRLSVEQAAQALNVTKAAIYQLCARGLLPRVKIGGRLSFRADVLLNFIESNESAL
jgi:excisionase family DNA binding protein